MPRWFTNSFCLGLLVVVLGCSNAKYAPVEGVVTLDGEPLEDATVTFTPTASGGNEMNQSFGRTDATGKYSLQLMMSGKTGALIGNHKVSVAKNIETESDIMTEAEAKSVRLPSHDLTFDVKSGKNEADFNLETGRKK